MKWNQYTYLFSLTPKFKNIHFNNFTLYFQTVGLDGGEYRNMAGEFNLLTRVTNEQWDMMEQMIRASNKKSKDN